MMDTTPIKISLGKKAASLIEDGMIVGLGSGTTALHFINSLIERANNGLHIKVVSSSMESLNKAKSGGLKTLDLDKVKSIDITVDGADQIDPQKRMIKGAGAAHVREKILASNSKEMIVIIDETKLCEKLGKKNLPVEIIPFGSSHTIEKLASLGYKSKIRKKEDSTTLITENGNILIDICFDKLLDNPEQEQEKIIHIPGVVDTGFFFNLAGRVLIGYQNGNIKII